jgi:hypothetical protein
VLHRKAADAYVVAARADKAANNAAGAKLDKKAARQHNDAARLHDKAADLHQTAQRGGFNRNAPRAKAGNASKKAGNATVDAAKSALDALAGDMPGQTDNSGNPPDPVATANAVAAGQQAKLLSDQATQAGAEASEQGQAAAAIGTADGGWINGLVEGLGLTGITKTMLDHNRYLSLALVAAVVIFVFFYGTEPKVDNPFYNPNVQYGKAENGQDSDTSKKSGLTCRQLLGEDGELPPVSEYFPQQKVTEAELKTDLQNYLNESQARIDRLKSDLELKGSQVDKALQKIQQEEQTLAAVIKSVSALAVASAPVSAPIGPLIGIVTGALTAGLGADNLRKQSVVLKNYPAETVTIQ